jgi:hypothetical protein
MSLNFVSKSVLTSTDGVSHDTETDLEPNSSSVPTAYVKPLYEQLRQNAQESQDKYDEVTKSMRGAKTLDVEDVAYIESLEERKLQMMNSIKQKEEEELNMFRAAKMEKSMISSALEDADKEVDELPLSKEIQIKTNSSSLNVKPLIIIKKRRRKQLKSSNSTDTFNEIELRKKKLKEDNVDSVNQRDDRQKVDGELQEESKDKPNALGALLAYGSDSESD